MHFSSVLCLGGYRFWMRAGVSPFDPILGQKMVMHVLSSRKPPSARGYCFATWHAPAQRLLRRDGGQTSTQHACAIAVTIGIVLVTIQGLGKLAESTFGKTAKGLGAKNTLVESSSETAADTQKSAAAAAQQAYAWAWKAVLCSLAMLISFWGARGYLESRRGKAKPATAETVDGEAAGVVAIDRDAVFEKRHEILRILSSDVGILFDSRMHVKHAMSSKLTTVEPSATASEVRERMQEGKFRHVMVCGDNRRLLGVISDRDLNRAQAKTAAELMTPNPCTAAPDDPISPAITLLIRRRISCLPVVEGERLVGVLTTTDLMMALQCALHTLQKIAAEIAEVNTRKQREADLQPAESEAALV